MADMPGLAYGRISGSLAAIIADSTDAGENPDAVPVTGSITFTPDVVGPVRVTQPGLKKLIFPTPITCTIDADGDIAAPGSLAGKGVYLLATDSNNPVGWRYRVGFAIQYNGVDIAVPSFYTDMPGGSDRDLADIMPLAEPGTGTPILRGLQGYAGDMGDAIDLGNRSGVLDLSAYTRSATLRAVLTGNITSVVLPTVNAALTMTLTLVLVQDTTGGRTVAWPSAVEKADDLAVPGSTAANRKDMYHLIWDGAFWWLALGIRGAV